MTHDELQLQELKLQRRALDDVIEKLEQRVLEAKSQFKRGDVIQWKNGRSVARGRVVSFKAWCIKDIAYVVERIRRDGTSSTLDSVYPYHQATKAAE